MEIARYRLLAPVKSCGQSCPCSVRDGSGSVRSCSGETCRSRRREATPTYGTDKTHARLAQNEGSIIVFAGTMSCAYAADLSGSEVVPVERPDKRVMVVLRPVLNQEVCYEEPKPAAIFDGAGRVRRA